MACLAGGRQAREALVGCSERTESDESDTSSSEPRSGRDVDEPRRFEYTGRRQILEAGVESRGGVEGGERTAMTTRWGETY